MKINRQHLIITTSCVAALLFTGNVLAQTPSPTGGSRIKAYFYREYGSPDVLRLEEIDKPVPADDQVLVRVRAASVNPLDWHYMEGTPYIVRAMEFGLLRPKVPRLGVDLAGQVEAVGKKVTQFKPGDEVFGQRFGAFGEYVTVREDRALVIKPPGVTFEQAAALPVAAITALQGLRDKGKLQPGQKVLINGASGGVGTFAVQLAKTMGAEVTGVCSGRNVELVKSLGADHVIDYTKEDYTKNGQHYDVMLDNVANHSFSENVRMLNPQGKYVLIGGGGPDDQGFIGPLILPIKAALMKRFVTQEVGFMVAEVTKADLSFLADLVQTGKLKVVIDKSYPLSQLPEAMRYLETGRARGKVVITVGDNTEPSPAAPKLAGSSGSSPLLVALGLIGVPVAALIVPIIAVFPLNRRFRERNPEKRPYRWGYYFSMMAFIGGLLLGRFLNAGPTAMILCGLIYALLAWFFAQRHHWAWIALTILSFNPIAWIINAIYLRKRWAEEPATTAAAL
ncbi:MAG TPA: NAD(P)-dependent alcohol dehydrogenase [Chthoniobacterales bacterium]|nr:NAD(P)-dependent alcohol dehydrogenase [Chthoniobacterales bacterium]